MQHETHTSTNGASSTRKSPQDYLREFSALAEKGLPAFNEIPTAPWQRFFLPEGPWSEFNEFTGEYEETWVDANSAVVAAALAKTLYGPAFEGTMFTRIEWKDAGTGEVNTFYPAGREGATPEWIESTLSQAFGTDERDGDEQSNGEERS